MSLAIFGITNNGLNLAATLFLLMLVVLWLALIVYTYLDARRRISDPFLVACATVASFFPFIGTAVYAILRPPEFLEDAHERELEIRAAELRVRQLKDQTCPNCEYQIEKNFLRCPNCQRRLKDPCPSCGKPVDPRWGVCPYCETALAGREKRERRPQKRERRPESTTSREAAPKRQSPRRKKAPAGEGRKGSEDAPRKDAARAATEEPSIPTPEQRSPRREPDPDPRQA
jgi:Double zinc ribbon